RTRWRRRRRRRRGLPLLAAKGSSCQASGAVSLPCSAALGSLARACPREGALSRVGHLFRSKRKKFRVSSEAPTYTVLYLGNATTLQAKGEGCTDAAVGKIWAKSEAGRHGTKMKLTIGPQGIRMAPAASGDAAAARPPGHLYLLHRVTYCVADPRLPRLFAWIYRHEVKHKAVMLRCHAVLVSKAEKARAMALLLYQTSAAALAEFRRLKKRADARHQQLQQAAAGPDADAAIPLLPLRKLLLHGPAGCYKPPVERSRSAPKLGSITEDALARRHGRAADCRVPKAEPRRAAAPPRDGTGAQPRREPCVPKERRNPCATTRRAALASCGLRRRRALSVCMRICKDEKAGCLFCCAKGNCC
uniref:Family with sequence similarity 43 member A n=1 Tax=Salvator merianae TaxID=96440 RepID=A0A8D0CD70_SALMN